MDPSKLHFSKGHSLFLMVLMAAAGGVCLWFLLDHPLFAPPPPLPPAATGNFADPAAMLIYLDGLRESQPSQGRGVDALTGGWASALLLMACLAAALWEIGMKSWRLFSGQAALSVQNGQLVPHPSFLKTPKSIALNTISAVTFDRADRVRPDAMNSALTAYLLTNRLAMQWGARLRHILLVRYVDSNGHPESLRISDADVAGGVAQLERFANYLGMMANSRLDAHR